MGKNEAIRIKSKFLREASGDFKYDVDRAVRDFMAKYMPGMPLGLLDVSDPDRWEIEEETLYEVECHSIVTSTDEDGDPEEEEVYILRGIDGDICTIHDSVEDYDGSTTIDGTSDAAWFYLERDANWAVQALSRERSDKNRLGFPWAWNWFYCPEDNIKTDWLQRSGFTVAQYRGGDRDTYRLCGVDGAGYGFHDQHFIPLFCRAYAAWEAPIVLGEEVYLIDDTLTPTDLLVGEE